MKKILVIGILIILVISAVLTGCSSGDDALTTAVTDTTGTVSVSGGVIDPDITQQTAVTGEARVISAGTSIVTSANPATQKNNDIESTVTVSATQTQMSANEKKITLSAQDVYTGNLVNIGKSHSYSYKLTQLYTPGELDSLSAAKLRELGWKSLYAERNEQNSPYYLRTRLLFMKSEACDALVSMINAFAKESGKKDVQICYAYRLINESKDTQSLSDERVTGLVAEINVYTQEGTFAIEHTSKKNTYFTWFSQNCTSFGFIMTGQSGYFRYVGIPHAVYMTKNNLSLEDYLELLKTYTKASPLKISIGSVQYEVFYVKAGPLSQTQVSIDKNADYTVSGDNDQGYIITVKE